MSNGTHYVAECDGYVSYYVAKGAPKRRLYIYDANGKFIMQDYSLMSPSGVDLVSSPIFIKKGMQFALDSDMANVDAAWYTLLYWTPLD